MNFNLKERRQATEQNKIDKNNYEEVLCVIVQNKKESLHKTWESTLNMKDRNLLISYVGIWINWNVILTQVFRWRTQGNWEATSPSLAF